MTTIESFKKRAKAARQSLDAELAEVRKQNERTVQEYRNGDSATRMEMRGIVDRQIGFRELLEDLLWSAADDWSAAVVRRLRLCLDALEEIGLLYKTLEWMNPLGDRQHFNEGRQMVLGALSLQGTPEDAAYVWDDSEDRPLLLSVLGSYLKMFVIVEHVVEHRWEVLMHEMPDMFSRHKALCDRAMARTAKNG